MSFFIHPIEVDERPAPGEAPERVAARLAASKAVAGAQRSPGSIVLGADTVVALDSRALGKPESPEAARRMLKDLRGRNHRVITAVAAARIAPERDAPSQWMKTSTAEVEMRDYTDVEIHRYVESGDPMDKAGAYAIQHVDFRPVRRLNGCYLTVVGLPLPEVFEVLAAAGLEVPRVNPATLDDICPACRDRERLPLS